MTRNVFGNLAASTLAGPITATATTINLAAGTGTLFPVLSAGQQFQLRLISATNSNYSEIVLVTGMSSDALTVVRAQESTAGLAFNAGDFATHLVTAGALNNFAQNVDLSGYLPLTGGTLSGNISLKPTGVGGVGLSQGDSSHPGAIAFIDSSGTVVGNIGYLGALGYVAIGAAGGYSGFQMASSTNLLLDHAPTLALEAATKQYVDTGIANSVAAKAFWLHGTPNPVPSGVETTLSGWAATVGGTGTGTLSASAGTFTIGSADAGWWVFTAAANTSGASNTEYVAIYQNSSRVGWNAENSPSATAAYLDPNCAAIVRVFAGDVIIAKYFQDSGTTQTMNTNSANGFSGAFLGS